MSADAAPVELSVDDRGVGTLTLNRPDSLNAIDLGMIAALGAAVDRAWNESAIRCLVITGAGRAFCAGADLNEWDEGDEGTDAWVPSLHRVLSRLYRLPKPVIAAVNGVAVGAGLDLALTADLRVASTKARFGSVYINIGFCPDAGATYLLPRLIGETKATELIYTGRIIGADEADALGLLTALAEPDAFRDAVDDWAGRLAAGPTVAIGLAKENLRENRTRSFESALASERRGGELCAATADHQEGLAAVIERREPAFIGR